MNWTDSELKGWAVTGRESDKFRDPPVMDDSCTLTFYTVPFLKGGLRPHITPPLVPSLVFS